LSLPFGELKENTTEDIIDDMERIRSHLSIKQWLLFGGSWGGTLALLYAQQYTQNVLGLVIRGVFLARQKDLDWFIREGAGRIYPEQWQQLLNSVQEQNGRNLLQSLCDSLWSDDEVAHMRVAREWLRWGSQVSLGQEYEPANQDQHVTLKMVQQVRMELHYAKNRYFIAENQILEHCPGVHSMSIIIIHGRNDLVCPMEAGFRLHQALPDAQFVVLSNAGHVARGRQMVDALVTATDRMAKQINANPHAQ
jgi:proline iminopeptidase